MVNRYFVLRPFVLMFAALSCAQVTMAQGPHKFPLTDFENRLCRGKGRMQDCNNPVVRQVLAGGAGSIPVLISQLTETGRTKEPVEDFWDYTSSGDIAFMMLNNLFTDKDGKTITIRGVPDWATVMTGCSGSAETCWRLYVHKHGILSIQRDWQSTWESNQSHVSWDSSAQYFRLAN